MGTKVVRLRPAPELVRSAKFIKQVAAAAVEHDFAIELVGSPLAHPYYMLRKAGVAVTCVMVGSQPESRYNKLVRDLIPEIISDRGERPVAYQAVGIERTRLLQVKVVEEAFEVLNSQTTGEVLDELADLEEVAESLRRSLKITRQDVRQRRKSKLQARGGFDDGTVLISSSRPTSVEPSQPTLEGLESVAVRPPVTWHVQTNGRKVLINPVSPFRDEPHAFDVHAEGLDLHVEYRGSTIEVEVDRVVLPAPTAELPDDEA